MTEFRFEYDTRAVPPEEYHGMSVREKIRHHRICASEARHDAGAMWREGAPVGPEALPKKWHDNVEVAKRHEKKASELRGELTGTFED